MLQLRAHGEEALKGYLFIIFLSLIVYMGVQKEIRSVEIVFDTLRDLKCKVFDREIVIRELTKDQKKVFEKVEVIVPNTREFRNLLHILFGSFLIQKFLTRS